MMKYVALLRGINVGGKNKVEMKNLKTVFESVGCENVTTYLNTGNVLFESKERAKPLLDKIELSLQSKFGFTIPTLIKSEKEIKRIEVAIPKSWQNDSEYKTDVAFLFPQIDVKKTLDELPVKREFIEMGYVKGAIFWRIKRKNYNKSHLNKIIGLKLYQLMTVRNINTARFLAGVQK